jgi:succinoglycan biosynthesis transport protein ExoP
MDAAEPSPGDAHAETHLHDYVQVLLLRRWLILAVVAIVVAAAAARCLLMRPLYEASAQLLIERDDPNILNFKGVTGEKTGWGIDDYYQTQYKLLQSRSLARLVTEQLDLLEDPEFGGPRGEARTRALLAQPPGQSPEMEAVIDGVLSRYAVKPVRNSRLVNVSATALRPDLAARLTNALANLYIKQSLDMRFHTSSEAGQWLGGQVQEQRQKVEQADRELQDLKQQAGLVNIEERRTLLDQRLKELGTALTERKTERLQKEALWRQMAHAPNPEELPDAMRSGLVQSLRIELGNLERQQADLQERYLDEHPELVKVKKQISDTRAKIRAEANRVVRAAENDYKAAAAQEASVSSALEAAKEEALDLTRRSGAYDSKKRELDASRQVLDSLMARTKETDVTSELKATNIRVVDPAVVPTFPIQPRTRRDVTMALLLGTLLAVGLAFFLEYLDNSIKTPDDVKAHLGVPILGVVPELGRAAAARVVTAPKADERFREGYRVVRTALNYSWSEAGSRAIVVTSTAPGEGKTLTAVNLSLTLASQDQRVLLIDADLRKPSTHQVLSGVRRQPGLSDVLVGRKAIAEAVQSVPGSGLSYMPSGTSVPSPADLMTNRSMRGVLDELRLAYDWIVIDSPPVGAVAEPLLLAPLMDGVVIVVGAEMVPRKAVRETINRIGRTGARILGVVLNRAQVEKHAYYYGHYYGHYYGVRYGQAPSASEMPSHQPKASPPH